MEIKKISLGQMPPANKYVLIFLPDQPWDDDDDQYGKYWAVAKCVYGISKSEREKLSKSDSYFDQKRAKTICPGDEDGNNQKPYCFKTFGIDSYFGQDVDIWCELPVLDEKEYEKCFIGEDDLSDDFFDDCEDNEKEDFTEDIIVSTCSGNSEAPKQKLSEQESDVLKALFAILTVDYVVRGVERFRKILENTKDDKECEG